MVEPQAIAVPSGENMDSSNTFSVRPLVLLCVAVETVPCSEVLTIMATFMLVPISLAIEGPTATGNDLALGYRRGGLLLVRTKSQTSCNALSTKWCLVSDVSDRAWR